MKVDLHTHSIASPDGSLNEAQYSTMLESGRLDYVAVTDHNTIDFAKQLRKKLGNRVIVGEEITTLEGEIIGLYLKQTVPPGLGVEETIARIRAQDGLVYIPHPFETVRKGLSVRALGAVDSGDIDIMETVNGRAVFQNRSAKARAWAEKYGIPGAASSDAHGWHGWGKTYSIVSKAPTRHALPALLADAEYKTGSPGLRGLLYPKVNRIRRRRA